MKQTAIQQAIEIVRLRIESIDETLMGKHTIHHLQQIERGLYELLEEEREQIMNSYEQGIKDDDGYGGYISNSENYYNETYK
jgi:hypothetical protein